MHELLDAFGIDQSNFDAGIMRDIGVFSRIIQDVETVYLSIDSPMRFRDILNFLSNVAESGYEITTEEVFRQPDAVTVSTIHQVKGLEYPVVFVVDVEANRFPGSRRNYNGWLPPGVIEAALNRGAYQGTREEEARLFYTAITRAERFLYVTGSANLPGGRKVWRPSDFSQRPNQLELSGDGTQVPASLVPHPQIRRIDETVARRASPKSATLPLPRDYRFRKGYGFSPPIVEMFGFGQTVHAAVNKLHEGFQAQSPTGDDAEAIAKDIFHLKHVPQSHDPVNRPGGYERAKESAARILRSYAEDYAPDFTRRRQVEYRFEALVGQALISGSIDLLLREDEQGRVLEAQVVDFKTLEGGKIPEENPNLDWTGMHFKCNSTPGGPRGSRRGRAARSRPHVEGRPAARGPRDGSRHQRCNGERGVGGRSHHQRRLPDAPHPTKCRYGCDFKALCAKETRRLRIP